MQHLARTLKLTVAILVLLPFRSSTAELFRYEEGTSGTGELKYVNDLPVMILRGSPKEMGKQHAALIGDRAVGLTEYPRRILARLDLESAWSVVAASSRNLLTNTTDAHQEELKALIDAQPRHESAIHIGNAMLELRRVGACSTFVVEPNRSTTGKPLFGRNLDLVPMGVLDRYSVVTICHPTGKHAFVSVGYPYLTGVISGMNERRLAIACLDVYRTGDGSSKLDSTGTPLMFCFRRILEECSTVKEAEELMRSMKRTTYMNLTVCDQHGAVVLEITPKNVVVRQATNDTLACTNHFRTDKLTVTKTCWRYDRLDGRRDGKFSPSDVADVLHSVSMGSHTVQSMIFEPADLKMHIGLGKAPVTARPMKELDLKPLFAEE